MKEIIKMVASKTGMSESMAKTAVEIVITQLKKKLPDHIGNQLESLLDDTSSKSPSGSSKNPLGGLMGNIGGILGKK